MATKKRKRNPQDATLRNIRALKKKISTLEVRIFFWGSFCKGTSEALGRLEKKVAKLEGAK